MRDEKDNRVVNISHAKIQVVPLGIFPCRGERMDLGRGEADSPRLSGSGERRAEKVDRFLLDKPHLGHILMSSRFFVPRMQGDIAAGLA
ncbi:MAG: hypothetical protein JRJ26_05190 [Deltaproteobacteria bacterium]|nr:hypothetical protein [Deltaproteobacteria bacterium]